MKRQPSSWGTKWCFLNAAFLVLVMLQQPLLFPLTTRLITKDNTVVQLRVPPIGTTTTIQQPRSQKKIVAFTNYKYRQVAEAWYQRLELLGYTEHVIVATDVETFTYFQQHAMRFELSEAPPLPAKYDTAFERERGRATASIMFAWRWHYILEQLRAGVSILLTDVDNVFARYVPLESFAQYDVIHAYAAYPEFIREQMGFAVCGGMTWLTATNRTIDFVERIVAACGLECDDQVEINKLLAFTLNITWSPVAMLDVDHTNGYFKDWPAHSITGASQLTGHTIKIWSSDFAYRGPMFPEVCPGPDNWVAMPMNFGKGLQRKTIHKVKLAMYETWNQNCGSANNKEQSIGLAHHAEVKKNAQLACLTNALKHLPIGMGRDRAKSTGLRVFAHHYDAGNDPLWNADLRLRPHTQLQQSNRPCTIWEVGAHRRADDSRQLMKVYPQCEFHAYEPIPIYFTELAKHWEGKARMHLHNYGLAKSNSTFYVDPSELAQQSTFIGESKEGTIKAEIVSLRDAIQDAGGNTPTLVEMNCEGCEWDLLPDMVSEGVMRDIAILQVGFHNYGSTGLGNRALDLCRIHDLLSQTHRLTEGIPFGWERWENKNLASMLG